MKSKKYVIVDTRRFFMFVTFVLVVLALFITSIFTMQKAHSSIQFQNFKEYHVLNGDNLWNISLQHMPKDYDVREMVYEIKELNSMETSYIVAGDTIKIPILND